MNRAEYMGFLDELAEQLVTLYGDKMDHLWIIFPNRRAGLFFTKALAQKIKQPVWSPLILSFEDFIYKFSDYTPADRLTLLIDLYEVYQSISPIKESFDNFYFWGEMLLKDFDEVDKYMINADNLFVTLKNLKEIDARFHFFSDEQKAAMESFWASTLGNPSADKKNFIQFWQSLGPIYNGLNKKLKSQGYGYQGMIYRHVFEKTKSKKLKWEDRQIIFAGFNALTVVEERIIKWFIIEKNGKIYWDLDAYYFDDPGHEAGLFLRNYYNDSVFRPFFPKTVFTNFQQINKKIRTISASQYSGQPKIAGNIIRQLQFDNQKINMEKTVVVVPDETLLPALLNSLPADIDKINITMGYPIINSSYYNLIDNLIELQEKARRGKQNDWFNHRNVIKIINHPVVSTINSHKSKRIIQTIITYNMIYVPSDLFIDIEGIKEIFKMVKEPADLFDYLLDILVQTRIRSDSHESSGSLFEKEFAMVMYKLLIRTKTILTKSKIKLSFGLVKKVIRAYARYERIPFTGEPLQGLQIMGLLETRNLDFDNVIIMCVNEGIFPRSVSHHSFIPFNVRRAYLLSTPENQDAIHSYLFYRLIQRAKNISLIYNSEDSYTKKAEPSRYIYQLNYESGFPITHQSLHNDISIQSRSAVKIYKDDFILEKLARYFTSNEDNPKYLTPSKLNLYLSCPLSFCYRHVYDIEEKLEVTEDLDAAKFGLILHTAMEYLYKPYNGKTITAEIYSEIQGRVMKAITYGFAVYHGEDIQKMDFRFEGKNLLGRQILRQYIHKILNYDQRQLPFRIIGLETLYRFDIPVIIADQKRTVSLSGVIDRIDAKDGYIRILDYKSGKDLSTFSTISELFDRSKKERNKAVFQTFLYALLYYQNQPDKTNPIVSGLYNFKELHSDKFDVRIKIKKKGVKSPEPVLDIRPWIEEFQAYLTELIQEIFDPSVPFQHPENKKDCFYCSAMGAPSELSG